MRNWIGDKLLLLVLPLASSFTLLPPFYHHVSFIIVIIVAIVVIVIIVIICHHCHCRYVLQLSLWSCWEGRLAASQLILMSCRGNPTFLHTYVLFYLHTQLTYSPSYIPTLPPAYLPYTYLPTYPEPARPPTYISTFPPVYLSTYPPASITTSFIMMPTYSGPNGTSSATLPSATATSYFETSCSRNNVGIQNYQDADLMNNVEGSLTSTSYMV